MTPVEHFTERCTAAGLDVLGAATVGRQVCVLVAKVPLSADGLGGLLARIGETSMTVSMDGAGSVVLWFMSED